MVPVNTIYFFFEKFFTRPFSPPANVFASTSPDSQDVRERKTPQMSLRRSKATAAISTPAP
jgi:hypothetical protein